MSSNKKCGIYVHIPYCKSKCSYCSFVSGTDFTTQKNYVEMLLEEIKSRAKNEVCDSIFIGGGTPSVLYKNGIKEIADSLKQNFVLDKNLEFTVEANPESCTEEFLQTCKEAGINRISLGLQSCNNEILKTAGRLHSFEEFLKAYDLAKSYGFKNISADLIMGLAGETENSFANSLKCLTDLDLTHLSVYALKCEEGTRLFESGYEPADDFVAALYDLAVAKLSQSGFNRYEVSNFARSRFESKHNIKYWTLAPYFGFGVSAHSYDGYIRRANTSDVSLYLKGGFLDSEIDVSNDKKDEFIMLGLRMNEGISLKEFQALFNESLLKTHSKNIETLIKQGYLILENEYLKINPKHMFIMNSIICALTD